MSSLFSNEPNRCPLIGITGRRFRADRLDVEQRYRAAEFDSHYADFPQRIADAGGLPVQLPYEAAGADVVRRLDGLVISGGQDIHPDTLGDGSPPTDPDSDPRRDAHEIELVRAAVDLNVPVLGICRGLQVLAVALGGSLIADLPQDEIDHRSTGFPVAEETHYVRFITGSTMFEIYGAHAAVNSLHHQAVDRLGGGLAATGWAPDGVVEAIELAGHDVVGVQWHPEWRRKDPIFSWLVRVANTKGGTR
ncbi:gamma-glutamyl-gamma-aminobutyrate hydrolase family protein [Nocardia nepalensis]|uniref:gamma-glutamyl-gamma-aminobutyrate hydrolase family protein n=1 Tax=Nocardia nepalensis TaxID=3375448 RepID=UPI003B68418F